MLHNHWNAYLSSASAALLVVLATGQLVFADAITGQVVIDGVVYGGDTNTVRGNGVQATDKRSIAAFSSVTVDGSIELHYRRAPTPAVTISGDQNLLSLIKTTVNRGVLSITTAQSYQPQLPLVIELSAPHLNALTHEGSGEVDLQDLHETTLKLVLNGSANVRASGQANTVAIVIHGSGEVDAKNLTSAQAHIAIDGSGDVQLKVSNSLKADISGSGNITYWGQPKLESHISGSGELLAGG